MFPAGLNGLRGRKGTMVGFRAPVTGLANQKRTNGRQATARMCSLTILERKKLVIEKKHTIKFVEFLCQSLLLTKTSHIETTLVDFRLLTIVNSDTKFQTYAKSFRMRQEHQRRASPRPGINMGNKNTILEFGENFNGR